MYFHLFHNKIPDILFSLSISNLNIFLCSANAKFCLCILFSNDLHTQKGLFVFQYIYNKQESTCICEINIFFTQAVINLPACFEGATHICWYVFGGFSISILDFRLLFFFSRKYFDSLQIINQSKNLHLIIL